MEIKQKQQLSTSFAIAIGAISFGLLAAGGFLMTRNMRKAPPLVVGDPVVLASLPSELPEYVPGELLVKFRPDVDRGAVLNRVLGGVSDFTIESQVPLLENTNVSTLAQEKFKARGVSVTDETRAALGGWQRIRLDTSANVESLIANFQADQDIEAVELNDVVAAAQTPRRIHHDPGDSGGGGSPSKFSNDYYFTTNGAQPRSGSWGNAYQDQWGLWRMNFEQAWANTTGSDQVIVAIVDSGVDYNHPELQDKLWLNPGENGTDLDGNPKPSNGIDDDGNGYVDDWRGFDFTTCWQWDFIHISCIWPKFPDNDPIDENGHGTLINGVVGAVTNNTTGIAGTNWNVTLMQSQSLNPQGIGILEDLVESIYYAVNNGADIINLSWGKEGFMPSVMRDVLDYAYESGVLVIAAAGNQENDASTYYPGSHERVLSIAAWCPNNALIYNSDGSVRCESTSTGSPASFSNFGEKVFVTAPGIDILSLRGNELDTYCDVNKPAHICGQQIVPLCSERAATTNNCPTHQYYRVSGTSLSTAHVTGLAALLASQNEYFTPELTQIVMEKTVEDVLTPGQDDQSGHGLVRADGATTLMKNLMAQPKSEIVIIDAWARARGNGEAFVSATIKNIGIVEATNVWYSVTADGQELISGVIKSLGPTETFTTLDLVDVPTTYQSTVYTFEAHFDNPALEWYPDNNTRTAELNLLLPNWPQDPHILFGDGNEDAALVNLDGDAALEVVVSLREFIYAWNGDGSLVPGFPLSTGTSLKNITREVAVADINADGAPEIIAGTKGGDGLTGLVYIWRQTPSNPSSWELYPGWPQALPHWAAAVPVILDVDGNGQSEILMTDSRGGVYLWNNNGTLRPGWPQPGTGTYDRKQVAVAADDLNGDGEFEIITQMYGDNMVYAFHEDGSMMAGWPLQTNGNTNVPAPAIADLDGDGTKEVLATGYTRLHVWTQNQTNPNLWEEMGGWPQRPSSISHIHPPVIADLDLDGKLEIIVALTSGTQMFVYQPNGQLKPGWPKNTPYRLGDSPSVANVDGQGELEIVFATGSGGSSLDGEAFVWRYDGTPMFGWPQSLPLTSTVDGFIDTTPMVGDVDGDGRPEIVVVDNFHGIGAYEIVETSTPTSSSWPVTRFNLSRPGLYSESSPSGGSGSGSGGGGGGLPIRITPE